MRTRRRRTAGRSILQSRRAKQPILEQTTVRNGAPMPPTEEPASTHAVETETHAERRIALDVLGGALALGIPPRAGIWSGDPFRGLRRRGLRVGGADDLLRAAGAQRDSLCPASGARIRRSAMARSGSGAAGCGRVASRSRCSAATARRGLLRRLARNLRRTPPIPLRSRGWRCPRRLGLSLWLDRSSDLGRLVSLRVYVRRRQPVTGALSVVGDTSGRARAARVLRTCALDLRTRAYDLGRWLVASRHASRTWAPVGSDRLLRGALGLPTQGIPLHRARASHFLRPRCDRPR